jgi:hypothetical protein
MTNVFSASSAWKWTKGEQATIPKDEGYGLMVPAFQSQELGLGMELTSDQLLRINAFWNERKPNYTEVESAIKVKGRAVKNPLLDSPFHFFF